MPTNEEIGTNLLIDVQKLVECPICCESLAEPLFLSCGHSFCKSCLDKLRAAPSTSVRHDANNSATVVRCPECRRNTRLPETGLPVNYCLRDVVNLLSDASASTTNAKMNENKQEGDCLLKCSICNAVLMNDVYISCCDCSKDEKARQMCPVCCLINHNGHKIEAKFEERSIVTISEIDSFARIPNQCEIMEEQRDHETHGNEVCQESINFQEGNDHDLDQSLQFPSLTRGTRTCPKRTKTGCSAAGRSPKCCSTLTRSQRIDIICCIGPVIIALVIVVIIIILANCQ